MRVVDGRAVTEVLNCLTHVLATAQQHGVRALWRAQRQLIQGQNFTTCLDNASTSSLGEAQRGNLQRGHLEQTRVVSDSAHDNCSLILLSLDVSGQSGNGDRRVVDAGHAQALGNDLRELGVGTTTNEAAQAKQR